MTQIFLCGWVEGGESYRDQSSVGLASPLILMWFSILRCDCSNSSSYPVAVAMWPFCKLNASINARKFFDQFCCTFLFANNTNASHSCKMSAFCMEPACKIRPLYCNWLSWGVTYLQCTSDSSKTWAFTSPVNTQRPIFYRFWKVDALFAGGGRLGDAFSTTLSPGMFRN